MEQNYGCKYCGAKFHREKTLLTHVCVKKRRYMEIDTPASRFGFRAFQRFYELTSNQKKLKTQQEFIDSPYYIDFAKFGNHIANLKPIFPEQFIEFVISNGVKLKDWTNDQVYYLFIEDLIKREPANSAAERTITNILEWCENNKVLFNEFFRNVGPNEGSYLIRTGKISPWVLYLCESAEVLMNSFNEDHSKIIADIIDPGYWMRKFKKQNEDVIYIKEVLHQAGL